MSEQLLRFDPVKYKETMREQWQSIDPAIFRETMREQWQSTAEGWHRWIPVVRAWVGHARSWLAGESRTKPCVPPDD